MSLDTAGTSACATPPERRRAARYSIERDLRWKWQGRRTRQAPEHGRTVNISSGGMLFTTNFLLPPGKLVEVGINWPVAPGSDGGLQLAAKARVVRSDAGCTAVEFKQREFVGGW
jgi:c-di-GMP-binding flagellar brake protein YcgR